MKSGLLGPRGTRDLSALPDMAGAVGSAGADHGRQTFGLL
jgi:hypothetical protein